MRQAFVETLLELARIDERVMLLTADLGYLALEPFAEQFPGRFLNVGVAEQNMIAVATGLAEGGFIPYCYSISNFATLRPYEFIRNGPILHKLPVRIVGMGGGFEYPTNGATHYGIEDLGVLRVQPGIELYAPADSAQTRALFKATAAAPGSVYYRLSKNDVPVPGLEGRFAPGRPELLRPGRDLLLVALGAMANTALEAARLLAVEGIDAGVSVVSSLRPVDAPAHIEQLRACPLVVSIESHYETGALGSLLAELIAEQGLPSRLVRCGVSASPTGITGGQSFMFSLNGIGPHEIADKARQALRAAT